MRLFNVIELLLMKIKNVCLHKRRVSSFLDISQCKTINPILRYVSVVYTYTLSTCKTRNANKGAKRKIWARQGTLRIHYFLEQRKRATTINQYLESITDVSHIQRQSAYRCSHSLRHNVSRIDNNICQPGNIYS